MFTSAVLAQTQDYSNISSNVSIIGFDDRLPATTTTTYPWSGIGFLRSRFADGK